MSGYKFSVIPAMAISDARISALALRVFCALASHADKNGECFPSQNRIADVALTTRQTVNRALQCLEELGYIQAHERYRDDGGMSSKHYTINHDIRETPPVTVGVTPPVTSEDYTPCNPATLQLNNTIKQNQLRDIPHKDYFEDFWSLYPRKVGKGAARRAWKAALKTAGPETLIAAARHIPKPEDIEFCPHPATWLDQERWLDESATSTPSATKADIRARVAAANERMRWNG